MNISPLIGRKDSRKFAGIIGCNYPGTQNELQGCVNDAKSMADFLQTHCGYAPTDIHMLLDASANMQGILALFDEMVASAQAGATELWLSYSGHGASIRDTSGDELDGMDECICPCDCQEVGFISDDLIYQRLIKPLPAGTTLFFLGDCCHSGTILDLPYLHGLDKLNSRNQPQAQIISISGCMDSQTSADAYIAQKYAGAMTWSFLLAMQNANYTNLTPSTLLDFMRILLHKQYEQVPQLAASCEQITNLPILAGSQSPEHVTGQHPQRPRLVTFEITCDMHFSEASWNIYSHEQCRSLFPQDHRFTRRYEQSTLRMMLRPGKYTLLVADAHGDGGTTVLVSDSMQNLVAETKCKSRLDHFDFTVGW